VPVLAREHGICENTIYRWKSKYDVMEVSEAKRPREQEAENMRLKKLLADTMLYNAALKEVASNNINARCTH